MRNNVILIGIDTLRADHLGVYGYHRSTSPFLDRLSKDSIVFENCFSQAPVTAASFMSMMTSRYPTYHGITDNIGATGSKGRAYALDPGIPTLAEILHTAGYQTGAFTDGGNLYDKLGFSNGFDYYSMNREYGKKHGVIPEGDIFYWLKENAKENFFLFFHTYAVHSPFFIPADYKTFFGGGNRIVDEIDNSHHEGSYMQRFMKEQELYLSLRKKLRPDDKGGRRDIEDHYDGAIRYVDDFLGRLVGVLEKLKIFDETVLIFTSDHGESFFDHGIYGHKQVYNEVLHVPLIMKIPGEHGRRVSRRVRSIDILPTVCDILRVPITRPIHGSSLLKDREYRPILAEAETVGFSLIGDKFKYIHHIKPAEGHTEDEIFEIEDVNELNNLGDSAGDHVAEFLADYEKELYSIPENPPPKNILYLL